MSLKHAILGLLLEKEMTGYELKTQAFDHSVRHFWNADQAQIYRTLNQLVELNLVKFKLEIQTDLPNRKRYSITEEGKQEFVRWQLEDDTPSATKEPFLIKFFFGQTLSEEQLMQLLQVQMEEQKKLKDELQQKLATLPAEDGDGKWTFVKLSIQRGIMQADSWIEWCGVAMGEVRNSF